MNMAEDQVRLVCLRMVQTLTESFGGGGAFADRGWDVSPAYNDEHECLTVDTSHGTLWCYPEMRQSIGLRTACRSWSITCDCWIPASRWHPEEHDEQTLAENVSPHNLPVELAKVLTEQDYRVWQEGRMAESYCDVVEDLDGSIAYECPAN